MQAERKKTAVLIKQSHSSYNFLIHELLMSLSQILVCCRRSYCKTLNPQINPFSVALEFQLSIQHAIEVSLPPSSTYHKPEKNIVWCLEFFFFIFKSVFTIVSCSFCKYYHKQYFFYCSSINFLCLKKIVPF